MQVSQPMLQLLLYKKAQNEQAKAQEANVENNTTLANNVVCTSSTPTSEDYKTADAIATQSLNEKQKIQIATSNTKIISTHSLTVSNLSPAEITKIKQTIYNLYHNTTRPGSGGSGSGSGTTPTPTPTPTPETPTEASKISFMTDFKDTDEMFNYISTIDSSISKESGISSNQLWKLTQRDTWEENNNNFFRKLNSSFNSIDTNNDDILSDTEIRDFLGMSVNLSDYEAKVEAYSEEIQTEFRTYSSTEKMNFAIEKAREYFMASGLTDELKALEKLVNENKIGYKDLNVGHDIDDYLNGDISWSLGGYVYYFQQEWNTATGEWEYIYDTATGERMYDATETDGDPECGLYLDSSYYNLENIHWTEFVATLVHEFTHATAFLRIYESQFGEYEAWQVEEDYMDSINQSQWSGTNEKINIEYQINTLYNEDNNGDGDFDDEGDVKEAIPTDKWWTYGDFA